ncbi:unnamed protein product [Cochlearia groenlandica]
MVATEVSTVVSDMEPMHPPTDSDLSTDIFDNDKLKETFSSERLDFDEWVLLISEIETSFPDDIEKLCLVYDAFLLEFPLCHGYWKKYAYHKIKLCTLEDVVEVFERAVQSATYSVDVWLDYCTFGVAAFEDPLDVSRLFERGLSFVGKDYSCYTLWDRYIEFLLDQKQWSSLAHVYLRTLRYPSKKKHFYYKNFKKIAASLKDKIKCRIDVNRDLSSEPMEEDSVPTRHTEEEISNIIKDLMGPSSSSAMSKALHSYLSIGEKLYQDSQQLMEKISFFETQIRRPYFHVNPLDAKQVENWHAYLSFAETYGDFDWAIKLYERCLIPCANCPEFWFRYVDFVESKGGRELANFALARTSQNYLKDVSVLHLFNARFKEHVGDASSASVALSRCGEELGLGFVDNVTKKANMEKRLGNFEAAVTTYKEALKKTFIGKENSKSTALLYVRFSRLQYIISNSVDEAAKILIEGNEKVPHCKLLLEELIRLLMMHGGSQQVDLLEPIISREISQRADSSDGLSTEDKEELSNLFMEFIDLSGTIHDVRRALGRHIKLFPHSARAKSHGSRPSGKSFRELIQRRVKSRASLIQDQSTQKGTASTVVSILKEKKELPLDSDDNQFKDADQADYINNDDVEGDSGSQILQSYQNQESLKQANQYMHNIRDSNQNYRDSKPHSHERPPQKLNSPRDNQAAQQGSTSQTPQNQYQQSSSQLQPVIPSSSAYPQAQISGQYMSAAPSYNPATVQSSISQNQHQDSASQAQTSLPYPQAQIHQYPVQSYDQQGQMLSSEAYNQMWQDYYYYNYYYSQQQQVMSAQPQPNQKAMPQLDPNLLQVLSKHYQSQAGAQYPQSQQFEQLNTQKQIQEPQHQQQQQQQQQECLQQQQQWQQQQYHRYQQQQQLQGEAKVDEQKLPMGPEASTRESDTQKSGECGGNENEDDHSSDTSISSI